MPDPSQPHLTISKEAQEADNREVLDKLYGILE